MKIINKSRKIIAIQGEALLLGKRMELLNGAENHPIIQMYLKNEVIADINTVMTSFHSMKISEEEKLKISEEAVVLIFSVLCIF